MARIKLADYLGKELFDLYIEKHPDVRAETEVIEIEWERTRGFQVHKPQVTSLFDKSLIVQHELVTVAAEDFEKWALDTHGPFLKLAIVPAMNCVYGARRR